MCFAPALANFALRFGPPEYFGLALMSFGLLTVFGGDQPIKSIVSTLMGLFIATIGLDVVSGVPRFCLRRSPTARRRGFHRDHLRHLRPDRDLQQYREPRRGESHQAEDATQGPLPHASGVARIAVGHRSGRDHRFLRRLDPRRGHHDRIISRLSRREAPLQASGEVRHGSHRGGRLARGGEQRGLHQRLCPAAGPGHSGISHHGRDAGGFHDVGDSPWPPALPEQRRSRLGPHLQQVHRQSHPAAHEHFSDPLLRHDPAGALHHPDGLHRGLRDAWAPSP